MLLGAKMAFGGRGATPIEYQGNPIVNLSGLYGTTDTSWTTLDDRYTFGKFSSSQSNLTWDGHACVFNGGNIGLYADVLAEDKISTEMTIEVVMSDFTPTSADNGIVFALDNGYSVNISMYQHCKGMRNAGTDGLISSYYSSLQDRPSPLIKSFSGLKTIAMTNGKLTNTRVSFFVNGVLTPSSASDTVRNGAKIPTKFGIGGTGTTATGWQYGLKAKIHAVRFHYGILTQEQFSFNHALDLSLYS